MDKKSIKLPNIVIIGKGPASKYLWNMFLKAYNYDEIVFQYHDKNVGTAKTIIDGLKNFGWVQNGQIKRNEIMSFDKTTSTEYNIIVNEVMIEKIGAIRGL